MDALRISYVEGVNPARWLTVWNTRHPDAPAAHMRVDEPQQLAALLAGAVDVAIVRGDVEDARLHRVRLYEERAVAAAARDHAIQAFDALESADLEGEALLDAPELSYADTMAVVESGAGIAVLPMSVARLHGTGRSVARPITDAPGYVVSLVWLQERDADDVQDFVGIARGRKAASSRGDSGEPDEGAEADGRKASKADPRPGSRGGRGAPGSGRGAKPRPGHRIAPKPRPRRGRR